MALLPLLATGCASTLAPGAARTSPSSGATPPPYTELPSKQLDPMGLYATGLALADINGDAAPDLIVASGNDQGAQPLAVYYNNGKGMFANRPDWLSEDLDSNTNLAVGDLNGDGWLDVAVSLMGYPIGQGGAKVYFNQGGSLQPRPAFRTGDRFASFACALGDADGDGDLDLAVSSMGEGQPLQLQGYPRIYFNTPQGLQTQPAWKSSAPMGGSGILFADVQQDGLLDLVVGAEQVHLYSGQLQPDGTVWIPTQPAWSSQPGPVAPYVDVGPLGTRRQWGVLVSRNDLFCQKDCTAMQFQAYVPSEGTAPVWSSEAARMGSGVKLADLDGDGVLDFAGGGLQEVPYSQSQKLDGSPLRIYLGTEQLFATTGPAFTSQTQSQIQAIDVANLMGNRLVEAVEEFTFTQPRAVLTLSRQVIGSISSVERDGQVLGPGEYTRVPGASWLSFARRLQPGERVRVRYTYPTAVDIANANQDCGTGDFIYYSSGTSGSSSDSQSASGHATHRLAHRREDSTCF
jgi:hypothetical protein